MAQVYLYDQRYIKLHRAFSSSIVKGRPVDLYKYMLRAIGDLVPLADAAFVSSPTSRRVFVRLLTTLDTTFRWQAKTRDISQAILLSTDLNDRDRLVTIPPPTIALPWKSELPPSACDLETLHRYRPDILLARPLYGGRDSPMRWFITFSTILRNAGYRKLQTYGCVFSKILPGGGESSAFSLSTWMISCSADRRLFYEKRRASSESSFPERLGGSTKVNLSPPLVSKSKLVFFLSRHIDLAKSLHC